MECQPYGQLQKHELFLSGRADRLGLAISLVAQVKEQVWYCRAKGYKPWFKPTAQDVKTHEEGGHTIWYSEPELLKVHCAESLCGSSMQSSIMFLCRFALTSASFKVGQATGNLSRCNWKVDITVKENNPSLIRAGNRGEAAPANSSCSRGLVTSTGNKDAATGQPTGQWTRIRRRAHKHKEPGCRSSALLKRGYIQRQLRPIC